MISRVQLLLDEMYPAALADLLRERGHDVHAVSGSELAGSDDAAVLDAATAEHRCLVTENVRDFAVLTRHAGHAGVLFVHGRRWPRTPAGIPRLAAALHAAIAQGRMPGKDDIGWLS
ncbi:DUF5615 family PIN-like protein [Pseudonocardia acaciae]|uniref:DUF5615 family PIN-like protein n=1 Tax=Pseudonocardia acaciae TaxID=551276 RepID=UPI000A8D0E7D|nr:DUF5615 family PIN-like protein [Pseudonocardia acaciae]